MKFYSPAGVLKYDGAWALGKGRDRKWFHDDGSYVTLARGSAARGEVSHMAKGAFASSMVVSTLALFAGGIDGMGKLSFPANDEQHGRVVSAEWNFCLAFEKNDDVGWSARVQRCNRTAWAPLSGQTANITQGLFSMESRTATIWGGICKWKRATRNMVPWYMRSSVLSLCNVRRGFACLVMNHEYPNTLPDYHGATKDVPKMVEALEQVGFQCFVYEDLRSSELWKTHCQRLSLI